MCKPGDVAPIEGVRALLSSGEPTILPVLPVNDASACGMLDSLPIMAAGAVGGESSGVCFRAWREGLT